MRRILTVIILSYLMASGYSQTTEAEKDLKKYKADTTEGWKKGATVSLNFTQVSLTNWAAGGQNSISANGLLSLFAQYSKNKSIWENYLDLGYGTIKQGKDAKWLKTDDKIDFTSKYGKKAFSNWYYAGLMNLKTQMTAGYKYPNDSVKISNFLAPAYLLGAIGLDYKKNDNFTMFVAPLTAKITFVNDQRLADAGAFGVKAATYDKVTKEKLTNGEKVYNEFGGYLRMFYKRDLMENVKLQTKLDLFSNYIHNPENIDVSWEVLLSMKVNKYITATLTTHLLYDDDINIQEDSNNDGIMEDKGPKTQFKEVFGIGFSYQF